MKENWVKDQLMGLLEGKVILVVSEEDFESLIRAAVPRLLIDAEELEEEEPTFDSLGKARRLRQLAQALDAAPKTKQPVHRLSTEIH